MDIIYSTTSYINYFIISFGNIDTSSGQNGVKRQVWLDCDIISLWVAFPFPYLVPIGVRRRPYETEVKARASRNLLRPPQIFNLPCRPGGAVGHEFFLYLSRWSSSTHVDLLWLIGQPKFPFKSRSHFYPLYQHSAMKSLASQTALRHNKGMISVNT